MLHTLMRRADDLLPLSHDHHSALVLARRCKQSVMPGAAVDTHEAWRQVREAFPRQLEPHFVIEERFLLPALEGIGESELVARVREDHSSLRALAANITADAGMLERFGLLLEAHVRFEERQVFEVAQQRLPALALEAIAEACRTIPRAAASCTSE